MVSVVAAVIAVVAALVAVACAVAADRRCFLCIGALVETTAAIAATREKANDGNTRE